MTRESVKVFKTCLLTRAMLLSSTFHFDACGTNYLGMENCHEPIRSSTLESHWSCPVEMSLLRFKNLLKVYPWATVAADGFTEFAVTADSQSTCASWFFFFFPVWSIMTLLPLFLWQVNGVPAAFAHREHGLLAHAVAAVGLRRQWAGLQSCLRR